MDDRAGDTDGDAILRFGRRSRLERGPRERLFPGYGHPRHGDTQVTRLRRTWPQRLLIGFNLFLIAVLLSGAGGLSYLYWKVGRVPTLHFADSVLSPEQPPGDPQNFLLVGSDSRAFVEPGSQEEESFGTEPGQRADTILLVRVDPVTKQAAMLSLPRDLWVTVAGTGKLNRINTAFAGGPEQVIETIKLNFNVPVHHYAQVDFKGFKELVDAVGGVEVFLASAVRDPVTGLDVSQTGCVELQGDQALAYVRSRHLEYLQENGRWREDPTGDLGRITRQQDFIRRAIREAFSKGLLNPARLNRLLNVGIDNVKRSESLRIKDLTDLGRNFRSLSPESIQQFQLPVKAVKGPQGQDILVIDDRDRAGAEGILDVFRGVAPETERPVQPSGVSVRVLNGSGRTGEAGDTSSALQQLQFAMTEPGNANGVSRTIIRYGAGQEAKAKLLESYLKAGASMEEQPGLSGVDVVLTLGADFAGVLAEPRAPEPAPIDTTATTAVAEPPAAPEC
jgi:polyisoprenyl-teichoic acid--peptidoglycan teichoic acid transferase